jgi:hypothetical protein
MSRNAINTMILAFVVGICSVGFVSAAEEDKTKQEKVVVTEKAVVPGLVKESSAENNNVLAHEETVACGDLSKEPHDFNFGDFDLDNEDDDDDDI